jgi:hypothetical protein
MGFSTLGQYDGALSSPAFIQASRIQGGLITAKELIIAGGTAGVIRSQNFNGTDAGWAIFGDGSASFFGDLQFGADVTITGDVYSSNWDGSIPADLSSVPEAADAGYYLDSSAGAAQFQTLFIGGGASEDGYMLMQPFGNYGSLQFHHAELNFEGMLVSSILDLGGDKRGTLSLSPAYDSSARYEFTIFSGSADVDNYDPFIAMNGFTKLVSDVSVQIFGDGSAGAPTYSFYNDENSGMYKYGTDSIGWSTGGGVAMTLDSSKNLNMQGHIVHNIDRVQFADGSVGTPTLVRQSDTNTGWWWSGNHFSFSVDGDLQMQMHSDSNRSRIDFYDTEYSQIRKLEGTELYIDNEMGNRDIYFRTDNASGIKNRIFLDGSAPMRFHDHNGTIRVYLGAAYIGSNATVGISSGSSTQRFAINWSGQIQVQRTTNIACFFGRKDNSGGIISFRYNGSQVGYISVNANLTSVTYGTSSDVRLKDNVRDYGSARALDKIMDMKLREWEWNIGKKTTGMGFVAQELVDVAPSAVEIPDPENDAEGDDEFMHWNVDYGKLTSFLVGGMQEQQQQIDELRREIQELRGRLR